MPPAGAGASLRNNRRRQRYGCEPLEHQQLEARVGTADRLEAGRELATPEQTRPARPGRAAHGAPGALELGDPGRALDGQRRR